MNTELNVTVKEFLNSPLQHFVNGQSHPSINGKMGVVTNPVTGETIVDIAYGSSEDVDAAAQAAFDATKVWGKMIPSERSAIMHRFADLLESEVQNIAEIESLDVGKPLEKVAKGDILSGIECARYFADLALNAEYDTQLAIPNMDARIHRSAYGVCGFIFPWNFPILLFMWNVMPAIAAGNTAVVKPSEVTPLSSLYVAHLAKKAGIPDGVINIIIGDGVNVGSKIVEHPLVQRMSFTGSTQIGIMVAEKCASRPIPCKSELGGKGAAVVFEDCDLDKTVSGLVDAITKNTGQTCCTATRWFVHADIYDAFKAKAVSILENIKIGSGLDLETEMGPLVSKIQEERILSYYNKGVADGANLVFAGGKVESPDLKDGYFVSPCLMEGDTDNVCYREEIFGPTAYLVKFSDEDKVIEEVNNLQYGLANSVWSADSERCDRVAEQMVSGNSWINAHNVFAYGLPYAGVNLSGVGGGVNSPETFYDYLRDLTIARPLNS
ncbi:aldehyde dehydrogenase family protein [Marinomonas sp. TI.3.20]|uniref:aldehyde dehydrogenase family protein n=1 Tax=Marinomonas sp. TI.3.20 TaxID=3121296 RepID=UPI00311E620B